MKMWIRIKPNFPVKNIYDRTKDPGVLIGSRYYTHRDGPFELDHERAESLIKQGFAEAVAMPERERAIEPPHEHRIENVPVAAVVGGKGNRR